MSSLPNTRAVVLSAGFGSRLAPLTDTIPKPLVPVANRPVLDLVLDRLAASGIREVGVNLHHGAEMLSVHLERRAQAGRLPRIRTVIEPEILDTAGGIAHFRNWAEDEGARGLLVHNSDIVTDLDIGALLAEHHSRGAAATVALVDHGPTNVVSLDDDGALVDIRGTLRRQRCCQASCEDLLYRTFSGVYVLGRRFLPRLVAGQKASIIPALLDAMREEPGSVRGYLPPPGTFWHDLGHVTHYLELHREILLGGRYLPPGMDPPSTGILIDPAARIEPKAALEGFVAIGASCHIGSDVRLFNCVVWPGTRLVDGFQAGQAVILNDLVVAA